METRHYAHIANGLVENVTLWDGVEPVNYGDAIVVPLPFTTDEDGTIRYTAGIGWSYRDGKFIDERPEPENPFA